jgi:HK97 family phage major capsid protein
MAYNNVISRSDVAALIPEQVADSVVQSAVTESAALSLFPRVPMSSAQTRMPVLAALPIAYFVNGDTGLKQTTEQQWANRYLNVEEIATIVPIPENVLDDTSYDVWGAIMPRIAEAVGRTLDAAIFFGTNKPGSWPADIASAVVAAGNFYTRGTNAAAAGGIAEDVNQLMGLVESDGFAVNGFVTRTTYKARLRSARDTTGQRLLDVNGDVSTIDGGRVVYSMPGLWPTGTGAAEVFAGDWTQAMLGVRKDMTYKILDQAVIQDNTGAIIYNLAQQDMVAMRVTARFAYSIANPINYENLVDATRFPFAALRSP